MKIDYEKHYKFVVFPQPNEIKIIAESIVSLITYKENYFTFKINVIEEIETYCIHKDLIVFADNMQSAIDTCLNNNFDKTIEKIQKENGYEL